jgi:hypothetical protein
MNLAKAFSDLKNCQGRVDTKTGNRFPVFKINAVEKNDLIVC